MKQEINSLEIWRILMNNKNKTFCRTLNYIKHSLALASTVTGCNSISPFSSSVHILCAITAWIKKYKLIITKNKKIKKLDKLATLAQNKFNSIEVLISKRLINFSFVTSTNLSRNFCYFWKIKSYPWKFSDF